MTDGEHYHLRAENAELREALALMPLESMRICGSPYIVRFSDAAFEQIYAALTPTGEHEHPDTALLNKLERQKLAGESWTLLERAGGGIPYPVADESRSKAIRYQTAREAIAALKEVEHD